MKVFQLRYNEDTEQYYFDSEPLHCGTCLDVLIFNGLTGHSEWVNTRLEMNGNNEWYLIGLIGYQISGLFARI